MTLKLTFTNRQNELERNLAKKIYDINLNLIKSLHKH